MSRTIQMKINGKKEVFMVGHSGVRGEIPDEETLCTTLRERLNLTGTKEACGQGACGCCTVLVNRKAVPSCQIFTADCDGKDIVTIEGLEDPVTHDLDPIQKIVIEKYAFQCGFCTPGIIMTLKGLFLADSSPTRDQIAEALSGNQCRCISQYHVLDAAVELSRRNKEEKHE